MKEIIMSESAKNIRLTIDRLREIEENDSMDNSQLSKLMILARAGLVPEEDVRLVRAAMVTMGAGRIPTPAQRDVLLNMLGTLTELITSDMSMFQRIKTNMGKGDDQEEPSNEK
tara:strand:+ start:14626 stop:14967 length:342 start_codon:yes stop_codon:yes gene_type:complete